MPLREEKGSFEQNIREMVRAGHPVKQAVAAAYRQDRKLREGKRPKKA